jgi:hypothetical protein
MPLAIVSRSGLIPKRSHANSSPTRPNPVIFVGDEQDVVLSAESLDRWQVAVGRMYHPARAEHRFVEERGDAIGALLIDQRLECRHVIRRDRAVCGMSSP